LKPKKKSTERKKRKKDEVGKLPERRRDAKTKQKKGGKIPTDRRERIYLNNGIVKHLNCREERRRRVGEPTVGSRVKCLRFGTT